MAVYKLKHRVKASPKLVWEVVSNLRGLAEIARHISKVEIVEGDGEGVGCRRRVYDRRGGHWIEECVAWEEGRSYTMRVDASHYPFSFSAMEFTWGVEPREGGAVIRMRYDYTPRLGILGRIRDRLRFRKKFEETCAEVMEGLVQRIHAREWVYSVTVHTILEDKGHEIISVTPETRVIDTAHLLREHRIGSVLALSDDGGIAGVVSERDIVRGLSESGPDLLDRPVSEIMTADVVVCHPQDNMERVLSLMTDRRVRHLPVIEDDQLVGIISIGDVVKTRINELESESTALKSYIEGRDWLERYQKYGPQAGHQRV